MSYCYSSRLYRARAAAGRCTVQEPLLAACTVQQEDPCHALCLLAWRVRGVYIAFAWRARGVCMACWVACAQCAYTTRTPAGRLRHGLRLAAGSGRDERECGHSAPGHTGCRQRRARSIFTLATSYPSHMGPCTRLSMHHASTVPTPCPHQARAMYAPCICHDGVVCYAMHAPCMPAMPGTP